jgi:hypothetical protein
MGEYTDHNDSEGRAIRLLAQASNADRRRMLAVLQERDMGCVTLCMSKHELRARRAEARWPYRGVSHGTWTGPRINLQNIRRMP